MSWISDQIPHQYREENYVFLNAFNMSSGNLLQRPHNSVDKTEFSPYQEPQRFFRKLPFDYKICKRNLEEAYDSGQLLNPIVKGP